MSTAQSSTPQSEKPEDRRRFHRIRLDVPLAAHLRDVAVNLVDLSLNGARVISDARFTPGGDTELVFDWNDRAVQVVCEVVRCTLYSFAKAPGEKSLTKTGQFVMAFGGGGTALGKMFNPHGMDLTAAGRLYVVEQTGERVQEFAVQ